MADEWALYLGDKIVTVYDSLDEAGEAYAWYVETYGTAQLSEVLKIGQVRDADA